MGLRDDGEKEKLKQFIRMNKFSDEFWTICSLFSNAKIYYSITHASCSTQSFCNICISFILLECQVAKIAEFSMLNHRVYVTSEFNQHVTNNRQTMMERDRRKTIWGSQSPTASDG